MAIEIQGFETRFGDSYEKAYARIVSLSINYTREIAEVSIGIYRSELDREIGKDPVSLEKKLIEGSHFIEFFKELQVDKIDASINPIADIYNDLTIREGKYKGGKKLYDEMINDEGEVKEISKDEKLKEIK
jgi:hypothetical protein